MALPFKASFNTCLHSFTPSALRIFKFLIDSGNNSSMVSFTAMDTPPLLAYKRPPFDAYSMEGIPLSWFGCISKVLNMSLTSC